MVKKIRCLLYEKIEKNEYLNKIYEKIIFNNLIDTLNIPYNHKEYNPIHALQFADILSKAAYVKNEDIYRQWGQEIAILTLNQHFNNKEVKNIVGNILTNLGNYQGIANKLPEYKSMDLKDKVFDELQKKILQIPNNENKYFFRNQKMIYDSLENKYFSYSGKTSLGKTFIMLVKIENEILNNQKKNYAIIVPSKSLINDIYRTILNDFGNYLHKYNYKIITSASTPLVKNDCNYVFILTPERLLHLLIQKNTIINDLFIDEAHKISDTDTRSSFYYKIINLALDLNPAAHIYFASPNIPNPEIYLKLISSKNITDDFQNNNIHSVYSPVNQIQYIINQTNNKISFFNQYTKSFIDLININEKINYFNLIKETTNSSSNVQNLVYANKIEDVQNMALEFSKNFDYIKPNEKGYKELNELSKYIEKEIHNSIYLVDLVKKGIAYHIGNLSTSVRVKIEKLYIDNIIHTLFCTSTLIEGINLPADNLFILSYENEKSNFTNVEFKNLIGRVGRIKYNLYGNVFVIIKDASQKNTFYDLIKKKVSPQKLSISSSLSNKDKSFIIENLKNGIISFDKQPDISNKEFDMLRRFAIMLLKDIMDNKDTLITNEFNSFLKDNVRSEIINKFIKYKDYIDDDINTSLDQILKLNQAIEDGLEYPSLNFDTRYNDIIIFLEKLCEIFNWEKYDKDLVGNKDTDGNHKAIKRHALILNKWFYGMTINKIISDSIEYYKNPSHKMTLRFAKTKEEKEIEPDPWYKDIPYDDSMPHRNKLITDTLKEIEHIILFKLSNYFHKFSTQYKKIKNINNLKNDWYEYVEYGTTEGLVIFLQQVGFTRETSLYIYKNSKIYIKNTNGETKLTKLLLDCENESVADEANMVYKNITDLFINN